MINSRRKGKAGELEVCRLIKAEGYDVHRTAQVMGKTGGCADVEGLDGIHIEVKRCQQVRLEDWLAQAVRDSDAAGRGEIPIVLHRKNNCGWKVTMRAEDWFKLYRGWREDED